MTTLSPSAKQADSLRTVMRHFVTGVTVVTFPDAEAGLWGLTASSFTSVSLDPPLVLVCVSKTGRSYERLRSATSMAVHILAEDQSGVAVSFARSGADRSTICSWTRSSEGNPLLEDFIAVLECALHEIHDAGDHVIVVGRVIASEIRRPEAGPLVYHQGRLFPLRAVA
jgi:flavin reductase (DIM6/NTAB) family NADH-FMN oxidoreductase RutF